MPQTVTGNKMNYWLMLAGMPVAMSLAACEAINPSDLPNAPKRISSSSAIAVPANSTSIEVEESNEIPEAPPVKTYVYDTGYSNVWQETQSAGQVVTEPSVASYDETADASTQPAGEANFDGNTYSVIDPTASPSIRRSDPAAPAVSASTTTNENRNALSSSGSGGIYGLHLASYRVAGNATDGWQVLENQHASILSNAEPRLRKVNLPGKGAFFRLVAGPFPSKDSAKKACDAIKVSGDYCVVTDFAGAPL